MSSRLPVEQMTVSPEYFDVLDIDVVTGRGFTQAERIAEAGVVVVSETIARRLCPNRNAVGQEVRLQPPQSGSPGAPSLRPRPFTVVGVVREMGEVVLMPDRFTFRGVYLPTGPENPGDCGFTSMTSQLRKWSRTASRTTMVSSDAEASDVSGRRSENLFRFLRTTRSRTPPETPHTCRSASVG